MLAEYLRHCVKEEQTNWDQWVPFASYVYNTTEHAATGFTPYELLFGHPSILPSALNGPPPPSRSIITMTVSELRNRMQTSHQQAYQNLIKSKNRSKEYYDEATRALRNYTGRQGVTF